MVWLNDLKYLGIWIWIYREIMDKNIGYRIQMDINCENNV